ncbi:Abi-alpha family protein [Mesorhizobium caraganae]|uniref:Abi-alpha family protein n=1 Tax=Mesorhizobium caraganae TaxID=483206 RepID=UPI0017822C19|nr:Abi-alpha family protein [Mesorhizobium caraganae]
MNWSDKQSEAVQEVAKTVGKLQPGLEAAGKFIAKVVGHPLTQAGGLIGDAFGIARLELFLKYEKRVKRIMAERGTDKFARPLPLSVAYPLLEAASLEEDDDLSEMLAHLLVNATDADSADYIPRSFVETLRNMAPFEALILKRMVEAPPESLTSSGHMYTAGLPDSLEAAPELTRRAEDITRPSAKVSLALASLETAGCVDIMTTMNGGNLPGMARVKEYGHELIRVCSAKKQS